MEIILKQDVDNLGHKDQVVSVKPGYANNFLIPNGLASAATAAAKKVLAENIRQRAHKEAKMVGDAQTIADKLTAVAITVMVKASEKGKIFGAVTTQQIADAIADKGFSIDKKDIKVGAIKEVGEYKATVKIYRTIQAEVTLNVVSTTETVAAAK